MFGKDIVKMRALRLLIGAICAAFPNRIDGVGAFIGGEAEVEQAGHNLFDAALDLALLIGVFDAQDEHAFGLLRNHAPDQGDIERADVHRAGGAGRKTYTNVHN